jgi:predicted membrane protein
MDTTNKNNVLFIISSIVLMTVGGLLLNRTLNVFYGTFSAMTVISLSLLSVFLYVAGAFLMGRGVNRNGFYRSHDRTGNGIVFALLLIAAGMLLLGFNTGNLPAVWEDFFFSWPMALLIIGVVNVCRFRFLSGIIIAATGKFFLFSRASGIYPGDVLYEAFVSTYWPVLIIVSGMLIFFAIIIKSGRFRCRHSGRYRRGANFVNENENQDGKINFQVAFGGSEQVILDPVFKGGRIDIRFGGMELDLRRTSLAEGDTFLSVKTFFGGLEIKAPDSWEIETRSALFVGGVDDSRVKNNGKDKSRKLILVAKCTFGGIEIK